MARPFIHTFPILLVALLLPLTCHADGFSFRPHPLPESRSFAVLDLGIAYRLNGSLDSGDHGLTSLDLGYMKNLSEKNAAGFSLFGLIDASESRLGVRARYRRWLSPRFAVDATAGAALWNSGSTNGGFDTPGAIASVGVQASGIVGVTLETEQLRFPGPDESDWDWRIGAHLGSGAGLAGVIVFLALGAIWAASSD